MLRDDDRSPIRFFGGRGIGEVALEQYVATRVGPGRISTGRVMLQRNAALLSQIEAKYGVPRQITVAIRGLETEVLALEPGKPVQW